MTKNDMVMHPSQGVCKIKEIRTEDFSGMPQDYYVLEPIYAKPQTTLFVPTSGGKLALRKLLSVQEIDGLIEKIHETKLPEWPEDDKSRRAEFVNTLKAGAHFEVMKMLMMLYHRKKELQEKGKKLHAVDERTMESAEQLLHQEFAYALNIEPNEVVSYILNKK